MNEYQQREISSNISSLEGQLVKGLSRIITERLPLLKELSSKHYAFIQAVRNKEDTTQTYAEANKAFQALLDFDARNNS